ncbi:hypothetical protein Acr_21g0003200 [Actinidia rufa]|uniref:Uncharacterized protein n=1 Tax=Actinidia rufa TaxID=165716 RepID=A0A7J0GG56_9ERIC|nr:hypothetical protein Acr_21g0003200 [Actinidia rufa]
MDQPDSNACGITDDVDHLQSCENLNSLEKEKFLPQSCTKIGNANAILERQAYNRVSAGDCRKEHDQNNYRPQSSAVSSSRNLLVEVEQHQKGNCAEGTYGATPCSNGFESSTFPNVVSCDGNPKDGEVSIHSFGKIDSTQRSPVNNDVGSQTGQPLGGENRELVVGREKGNWQNDGQDSIMEATFHDTQRTTESLSSNSTNFFIPVSSSDDNNYEVSVEAKSSMHRGSCKANFICTGLICGMEETDPRSAVLDMAAQITQKAVCNVRARDYKIEPGMIADQNPITVEKVDIPKSCLQKQKHGERLSQDKLKLSHELNELDMAKKFAREVKQKFGLYWEPSGSSSYIDKRNVEMVRSKDQNRSKCSTESGGVKLCNEQDSCDSFCSNEVVVDPEIWTKNKYFLSRKELKKTDPPVTHKADYRLHGEESSLLTAKSEVVTASDQSPAGRKYDLNDTIKVNGIEYPGQSVEETVSSYPTINVSMPIPVVAKCGIHMCLPTMPIKFQGEQCWKGPATTSAFRPAVLSKTSNGNRASLSVDDNNCSCKDSRSFTGIDLNVVAVGDDSAFELLPSPCFRKSSSFPFKESSIEISSKGAERLNIDLNFPSGIDNFPQSSPQVLPSRQSVLDFDLNENPSHGDKCTSANHHHFSKKTIDDHAVAFVRNSGQDLNNAGSVYWADSSSMRGFNHGHVQPFLVATPTLLPPIEQMRSVVSSQYKLQCIPRIIPPYIHPYNSAFFIDSTGHLSYNIRDPHGTTVIPQILGAGTVSTNLRVPHAMEGTGRPSPSDSRCIGPNFDIYSPAHSSDTGSRRENVRMVSFPFKFSSRDEQIKFSQEVSLTPMKRREPDGGWDSL